MAKCSPEKIGKVVKDVLLKSKTLSSYADKNGTEMVYQIVGAINDSNMLDKVKEVLSYKTGVKVGTIKEVADHFAIDVTTNSGELTPSDVVKQAKADGIDINDPDATPELGNSVYKVSLDSKNDARIIKWGQNKGYTPIDNVSRGMMRTMVRSELSRPEYLYALNIMSNNDNSLNRLINDTLGSVVVEGEIVTRELDRDSASAIYDGIEISDDKVFSSDRAIMIDELKTSMRTNLNMDAEERVINGVISKIESSISGLDSDIDLLANQLLSYSNIFDFNNKFMAEEFSTVGDVGLSAQMARVSHVYTTTHEMLDWFRQDKSVNSVLKVLDDDHVTKSSELLSLVKVKSDELIVPYQDSVAKLNASVYSNEHKSLLDKRDAIETNISLVFGRINERPLVPSIIPIMASQYVDDETGEVVYSGVDTAAISVWTKKIKQRENLLKKKLNDIATKISSGTSNLAWSDAQDRAVQSSEYITYEKNVREGMNELLEKVQEEQMSVHNTDDLPSIVQKQSELVAVIYDNGSTEEQVLNARGELAKLNEFQNQLVNSYTRQSVTTWTKDIKLEEAQLIDEYRAELSNVDKSISNIEYSEGYTEWSEKKSYELLLANKNIQGIGTFVDFFEYLESELATVKDSIWETSPTTGAWEKTRQAMLADLRIKKTIEQNKVYELEKAKQENEYKIINAVNKYIEDEDSIYNIPEEYTPAYVGGELFKHGINTNFEELSNDYSILNKMNISGIKDLFNVGFLISNQDITGIQSKSELIGAIDSLNDEYESFSSFSNDPRYFKKISEVSTMTAIKAGPIIFSQIQKISTEKLNSNKNVMASAIDRMSNLSSGKVIRAQTVESRSIDKFIKSNYSINAAGNIIRNSDGKLIVDQGNEYAKIINETFSDVLEFEEVNQYTVGDFKLNTPNALVAGKVFGKVVADVSKARSKMRKKTYDVEGYVLPEYINESEVKHDVDTILSIMEKELTYSPSNVDAPVEALELPFSFSVRSGYDYQKTAVEQNVKLAIDSEEKYILNPKYDGTAVEIFIPTSREFNGKLQYSERLVGVYNLNKDNQNISRDTISSISNDDKILHDIERLAKEESALKRKMSLTIGVHNDNDSFRWLTDNAISKLTDNGKIDRYSLYSIDDVLESETVLEAVPNKSDSEYDAKYKEYKSLIRESNPKSLQRKQTGNIIRKHKGFETFVVENRKGEWNTTLSRGMIANLSVSISKDNDNFTIKTNDGSEKKYFDVILSPGDDHYDDASVIHERYEAGRWTSTVDDEINRLTKQHQDRVVQDVKSRIPLLAMNDVKAKTTQQMADVVGGIVSKYDKARGTEVAKAIANVSGIHTPTSISNALYKASYITGQTSFGTFSIEQDVFIDQLSDKGFEQFLDTFKHLMLDKVAITNSPEAKIVASLTDNLTDYKLRRQDTAYTKGVYDRYIKDLAALGENSTQADVDKLKRDLSIKLNAGSVYNEKALLRTLNNSNFWDVSKKEIKYNNEVIDVHDLDMPIDVSLKDEHEKFAVSEEVNSRVNETELDMLRREIESNRAHLVEARLDGSEETQESTELTAEEIFFTQHEGDNTSITEDDSNYGDTLMTVEETGETINFKEKMSLDRDYIPERIDNLIPKPSRYYPTIESIPAEYTNAIYNTLNRMIFMQEGINMPDARDISSDSVKLFTTNISGMKITPGQRMSTTSPAALDITKGLVTLATYSMQKSGVNGVYNPMAEVNKNSIARAINRGVAKKYTC